MNCYGVLAKYGHVVRNKYLLKWFYVKASSKREAAFKVRQMPRVKHGHKDAIRAVDLIDLRTYIEGKIAVAGDLYFSVHSSTEQRRLNVINADELIDEVKPIRRKKDRRIKTKRRVTL